MTGGSATLLDLTQTARKGLAGQAVSFEHVGQVVKTMKNDQHEYRHSGNPSCRERKANQCSYDRDRDTVFEMEHAENNRAKPNKE